MAEENEVHPDAVFCGRRPPVKCRYRYRDHLLHGIDLILAIDCTCGGLRAFDAQPAFDEGDEA